MNKQTNVLKEQVRLNHRIGGGVKVTFQRPLDSADQLTIEDHFSTVVGTPMMFNWIEGRTVIITKD